MFETAFTAACLYLIHTLSTQSILRPRKPDVRLSTSTCVLILTDHLLNHNVAHCETLPIETEMPFDPRVSFAALLLLATPLSAQATPVTFETEDGVTISADIEFPEAEQDQRPAIIFIHQGGSGKSEWVETELYKQVVKHGMVALAYDVRGHGDSGGKGGRSLFDDPKRAPKDLHAALKFLAAQRNIDMSRIAIVGSSIGANLALVGLSDPKLGIKTAVAISGKTSAWINLAGGPEAITTPSSVYLIAAENEQGGLRAVWAKEMFDASSDPRQLEIVPGSDRHGTNIVTNAPELERRILNWLTEHL